MLFFVIYYISFFTDLKQFKQLADSSLQTYFNAWTKNNQTLSNEYILKFKADNSSRVAVFYGYSDSTRICNTTRGMPWQDLQRWTLQNCPVNDTDILALDVQKPTVITMDTYPYKSS